MKNNKRVSSEKDLLHVIDSLFNELQAPETEDEINEYLQIADIDINQFKINIRKLVNKELEKSPFNWKNKSLTEILEIRMKLNEEGLFDELELSQLRQIAQKYFNQLKSLHPNYSSIHHRDLEELSQNDLLSLVKELDFLVKEDNINKFPEE
jgi:hypothetical protein